MINAIYIVKQSFLKDSINILNTYLYLITFHCSFVQCMSLPMTDWIFTLCLESK